MWPSGAKSKREVVDFMVENGVERWNTHGFEQNLSVIYFANLNIDIN